jgi:hypothetical protein
MKKVIRNGVFETNSSSMHSISLNVAQDEYEPIKPATGKSKNRELTISCGEYGWGPDSCSSWGEKLSYVITSIKANSDVASIEDMQNHRFFKLVKEVVHDFTGMKMVVDSLEGYIDHQSVDMLSDYLDDKKSDEDFMNDIKELIFNKKYTIVIDNDNH